MVFSDLHPSSSIVSSKLPESKTGFGLERPLFWSCRLAGGQRSGDLPAAAAWPSPSAAVAAALQPKITAAAKIAGPKIDFLPKSLGNEKWISIYFEV